MPHQRSQKKRGLTKEPTNGKLVLVLLLIFFIGKVVYENYFSFAQEEEEEEESNYGNTFDRWSRHRTYR